MHVNAEVQTGEHDLQFTCTCGWMISTENKQYRVFMCSNKTDHGHCRRLRFGLKIQSLGLSIHIIASDRVF